MTWPFYKEQRRVGLWPLALRTNSEDSLTMTCCLLLVLRYLVYLLQVKSNVLKIGRDCGCTFFPYLV
jgi:hypothetical protein